MEDRVLLEPLVSVKRSSVLVLKPRFQEPRGLTATGQEQCELLWREPMTAPGHGL